MRYGETRRQSYRRGFWDGIGVSIMALCLIAMGLTIGVLVA